MTDVSIVGAVLAGLVSFLSPCVLPLVPGYVSMLSGIGMEQLRQGQPPRAGLLATSLAFVAGFSSVFISFGASASAVGQFLRENRALLAPVAGALILMFGLHLLGWLGKLSPRVGIILGVLLVSLGFVSALPGAPLFAGFRSIHFFSFALIGFFGPVMGRWLNRDVRLHNKSTQPGIWSGFLLGFAFAFGWTPCVGPVLTVILTFAAAQDSITKGVVLLAIYSMGLAVPFLLTALGVERFLKFYSRFRAHMHAIEVASGALLVALGVLLVIGRFTIISNYLSFLNRFAL